jgi:hypothetical protein
MSRFLFYREKNASSQNKGLSKIRGENFFMSTRKSRKISLEDHKNIFSFALSSRSIIVDNESARKKFCLIAACSFIGDVTGLWAVCFVRCMRALAALGKSSN